MSWLNGVFRGKDGPKASQHSAPASAFSSSLHSTPAGGAEAARSTETRRELLKVVLRDTLNRHGIPTAWLSGEVLGSASRSGEQGVHWRLAVKHWDPRLMVHGIALQQSLINRLMSFDPEASNWLTGISWRFALPDESVCPPMPPPGVWTHSPAPEKAVRLAGEPPLHSGDVGSGPARVPDPVRAVEGDLDQQAKADLQKLFQARDADYNRASPTSFEKTQAMQAVDRTPAAGSFEKTQVMQVPVHRDKQ